jgi:hypothetical protein
MTCDIGVIGARVSARLAADGFEVMFYPFCPRVGDHRRDPHRVHLGT